MAKITRKGVYLSIQETDKGEWRLLRGNKILSRHQSREDAYAAYETAGIAA